MSSTVDCNELLPGAAQLQNEYPQRIPYPDTPPDAQGVYGNLTNGQRIAWHLPQSISEGIAAQSGALLRDGNLPPELRELIIVRTGYHTGSRYEVEQHRSLAAKYGAGTHELNSLACRVPDTLDEHHAVAIKLVDALITSNRVDDRTLKAAKAHFSDAEILEIVFVVGNWWTLARMLETSGIPLDSVRIGD